MSAAVTRVDRLPRPRRRRWPIVLVVVVVALGLLAVIADRVSLYVTEDAMAGEIKKQGFPSKPDVTIEGFPFLTQVVGRHFGGVRLKARNIPAGPLSVTRLDVRATDVRLKSDYQSGTLGKVTGEAFVGFGDLAKAGGSEVELQADGPDKVKATVGAFGLGATAIASVTKEGNNIRVKALSAEGFDLSDLGDDLDFTVPVSGLPLGMRFDSLSVTGSGVMLRVSGSQVKFG
ncbi:LmeA family phospholipid-binding protein [Actinomadura oligospora]|uniref:LmeA family phospholipid-binding protein n=1 Tax=Actinomadura oligospora TaxID=111804 RepID=UPI000478FC49|nr:DUF2993 domain-containing protein [Actinomadura oligospora]